MESPELASDQQNVDEGVILSQEGKGGVFLTGVERYGSQSGTTLGHTPGPFRSGSNI